LVFWLHSGQHSPPLPTASLVCPWRSGDGRWGKWRSTTAESADDMGWVGLGSMLLGPQKTSRCFNVIGLKTNSREGQFCDCWAAANIEDDLNISQLSPTCLISPSNTHLGQLEYCQKKKITSGTKKKYEQYTPKILFVDHHWSTQRSHVQLQSGRM